jgi:hypothetical protein
MHCRIRLLLSLPFFALMIWLAQRDSARTRLVRRGWIVILWLGFAHDLQLARETAALFIGDAPMMGRWSW